MRSLSEVPGVGSHDSTVHGRSFEHALVIVNADSSSIGQINEMASQMKVDHIQDYYFILDSEIDCELWPQFSSMRRTEATGDTVDFDFFIRQLLKEVETREGRSFDSVQIIDLSYELQFTKVMKSCKSELYRTWQSMCIPGWGGFWQLLPERSRIV